MLATSLQTNLLKASESQLVFSFVFCFTRTSMRTNCLGNAFYMLTHKRKTKGSREKSLFGRHERGNIWLQTHMRFFFFLSFSALWHRGIF